jgi:hypothetical protein
MSDSTRGYCVPLVGSLHKAAFTIAAAAVLSGCGNGVGIGSGQSPDPVVVDVPVAYVKRPVPKNQAGLVIASDLRRQRTFNIGADLFIRQRAAPSAGETNVTGAMTQGQFDVRDLEPSYDGKKIIFAMRGPFIQGAQEEDQPKWAIWEYDIAGQALNRVIASDVTAAAGHDVGPHYLPDGRIIFASTRQRQSGAILVDEGKPQFPAQEENRQEPAFVLHVMDADGGNIHQVSFNQSHDLDAVVMRDGHIVFTRWDNAGGVNSMAFYRMNPDGTDLQLLYGRNSHATGTNNSLVQFSQPREMPDGRILSLVRPFSTRTLGGAPVFIDTTKYVENIQPLAPDIGVLTGPAQAQAISADIRSDGTISPGGHYSTIWPLDDGTNRIFVSWSPCRVLENQVIVACTAARLADPNAIEADPLYGIWIIDPRDGTQRPVLQPEEGIVYTDIVAAQVRNLPVFIPDQGATGALDPKLVNENVGLLKIRSVYDLDGVDSAAPNIATLANPAAATADQRPARFLRLEKAVAIPDRTVRDFKNSSFGVSSGQGMREVLGYSMIEPDGSVVVKVPANVPIAISVLDRQGRRITARHQNWLQLQPGETVSCNGCHDPTKGSSHGRAAAFNSAWAGAPADGQAFPNTDQAIFANFGETMAEARARISCATDCAAETPSVDIKFDDVWTDPAAAGRPKDASFSYRYADLTTPVPTTVGGTASNACLTVWSARCRIVINYEKHIHPLWSKSRQVLDAGNAVIADHTCTTCHNSVDAMNAAQVPAAQLDLSDGISDQDPDHFKAYRELLSTDNEQVLMNGALVDRQVQVGVDPVTGLPIFQPVPVFPFLSTAGALASPAFFGKFTAGGTHAGFLSDAELKLLAEWVDLGAQYFNNPFEAPLN